MSTCIVCIDMHKFITHNPCTILTKTNLFIATVRINLHCEQVMIMNQKQKVRFLVIMTRVDIVYNFSTSTIANNNNNNSNYYSIVIIMCFTLQCNKDDFAEAFLIIDKLTIIEGFSVHSCHALQGLAQARIRLCLFSSSMVQVQTSLLGLYK